MDYDDNDAQDQNLHLVGEATDKVSPALRSYNLPKFDFDEGHLRFDNLVDNDVFLGITGQEDNQWIEEYSRGTSAIQFSSSAVELTSKNVWSEATSSESVEMLLKSVGQEDMVLEETVVKDLDACDRPNSLANDMDPNSLTNSDNAVVPDESHENLVASKVSSQETQNSGEGLDSVVIGGKSDSSLGVQEVDNLQNDANLETGTIANEALVIEMEEKPLVSERDTGSSDNLENRQEVTESGTENAGGQSKGDNNMENNLESLTISSTTVVETGTYSIDQVSVVQNVESLDKPSLEETMHVDEEPIVSLPSENSDMQIDEGPGKDNNMEEELSATEDANTKSEIPDKGPVRELNDTMQATDHANTMSEIPEKGLGNELNDTMQATEDSNTTSEIPDEATDRELNDNMQEEIQATEDANTKSEMPDSPISNVGSHVQSHALDTENVGGDGHNVNNDGTTSIVAGSSAEDLSNNASEVQTEDASNVGPHVQTHSVETENVVGGDPLIVAGSSAEIPAEDFSNNASKVQTEDTNNVCSDVQNYSVETTNVVGLDDEHVGTTSIAAGISAERPTVVISNHASGIQTEDTNNEDLSLPAKVSGLVNVDDETPSSEPDGVSMDQDAKLPSDFRDTDMDDTEASQKDVVAQESNSDMAVITDAVAVLESSKTSTPDTAGCVQTLTGIVATDDYVTEDQPRSPILGVSLLHTDNKEKVEVVAEKGAESDVAEHVVHEMSDHCDSRVENLNVNISEQTAEEPPVENLNGSSKEQTSLETTIPCNLSVEHGNKESKSSEDGVESLGVNMSDAQQVSVDIAVPSACDTTHVVQNGGGSLLDKPQTLISELSQNAKDAFEVTKEDTINENAPLDLQSVSASIARTEEKSFTFEVSASPVPRQSGTQNLDFSKVSSTNLHKDSLVSPQTPNEAGAKGDSVPKPRRRSAARETPKKDTPLKEKTPRRRGKAVDKSPAGHVMLIQETKESVKSSSKNVPDLNNLTSQFQQSFTDNQQVQLRAQILVYGSLISGMAPEESHMFAAFGQSDGGKKIWENAWHGCLERVRVQKSTPNPITPMKSPSGNKDPVGSAQSKASSSTVSPMIPISSPLWNISTDYRQTPSPSPLHPYKTPPVQGNNPAWLSQGPFPGQWAAPSPIAPFSARFSALPITEAVKLTTVKESNASGTSVVPVDPTNQPLTDSKSRKRKKVTDNQSQTNLGTPLVSNYSPKSVATVSTPVSVISKSNLGQTNVSKIEESKLQAADAALQAADAVSHCQGVWSQLERQKNSGLVSEDEAKLASSAVSIAAAASVAKVAAAAARIASNVAEQARLMADEVFSSSRVENHKAMSTDNPSSIISVAREAARRRIEAASAASKHAENLDAIVKAAELAAEAVSQAGKIVAMGNPMSLKALVEAGPEGYWKTPQSSSNPQSSDKQIVEAASNNKGSQSLKHGSTLQEGQKGPELAKTVALVSEPESLKENMPQSTSGSLKENAIKEGCLVEVYKNDHKNNGAWFAANVLTLKDGKAFVCYTEIQSDQGQYKEWVPLEVDKTQPPKVRIAHPYTTTMRPEGTRKRGRTALADSYFTGDRVDVWVQNRWCEAVVLETNKIDLTCLTVKFPANGETSIVRSWHVRPTHIWKDGKWIEWSSLKGSRSSEDDAPVEKRQKFGSPIVEGKEKDTFSLSVDLVGPIHQESNILPLATPESSFDIGKSSRNEDKAMKSTLKKERSRVVFGVPKPGKKQKFMDVSSQHSSMIPQAPGRRAPKTNLNLKNDAEEKQVAEVKSKTQRPRKPPVPSVRSLKDMSKVSKSASHDAISADENLSSNTEDAKGTSSSKAVYQRLNKGIKAMKGEVKEQSTSEIRRSNRKIQPTSRMLEGLQSSLTVSKIPSASPASQRSHNKVTSKGGSNPS